MPPSKESEPERKPGGIVTKRLFLALWPNAAVRQSLAKVAREALAGGKGRLVDPENLHLTLVFLGSVDAGRRACVEQVAAAICWRPFSLILDRLGCFARPRILWAGSSQTPEELTQIVSVLQEGLKSCGFQSEARPYRVHLTLARKVRHPPTRREVGPIDCYFDHLCLVESETRNQGAVYQVVASWKAEM